MQTGFIYASRHGHDAVVQVDADGQHDAAQIPDLLEALRHTDVAIGTRFSAGDEYLVRRPRRWAMSLLARAVSRFCGTHLTDVTSGFRASGPRAIALYARDYPSEYLGDTVESLVLAHRAGLVLGEVPVRMTQRSHGEPSQTPLRAGIYLIRASMVLALSFTQPHRTAAAPTRAVGTDDE